jgi:hypothetical protein
MYKTRFRSWGITKYNLEATMAALIRNIENRKRRGKRTLIYKNHAPFSRAKIASHLKKKGMSADQLLRKVPSDASIPAGFICVTPPSEQAGDTPSSNASAFTTKDQVGLAQTPPTSSVDSGSSSSGHIPTPQSTPNRVQEDSESPAVFPTFEAILHTDVHPWTIADPVDDSGPDSFKTVRQSFDNPTADHLTHPFMVDLSGEALFSFSPSSFLLNNVVDMNFHMSMSTYMQNPEGYQPLRCHEATTSQQFSSLASDIQPEVFASFCYLACISHGQGLEQDASTAASEAFKVYQTLIKQEHEHALSCLNIVLAILFMHGQNIFAIDLLKNAQQAALCHLHRESSVIVTINFMVQQASRTVMQSGITPARLRVVFDDFKESRTLKHPYTLLAGYNLAWRLASEGQDDGLEQARHLLSELQRPSEATFGEAHMQTIAILTTKARVLHDLKHRKEAEKLMSEAIIRIESVYPGKHPYALEAKRRHSILLNDVNRTSAAERRLVEVALGRVEVLGPDHAFSKESVKDVERFLSAPGREAEHGAFVADLTEATLKSNSRDLTTTTFQFW